MPDVRLVKPAVGVPQNIVCEPQSRFIFDFPMDAATLSRVDDHLVLTFDDGSTIRLENFYTAYSGENMPSFSVDGAEISGQDFFTAMNEPDLMPAAGPTAQVADGARFREYENMALLDGLDRLGGLDIGFDNGAVLPDLEEGGVSGLGGVTTEYYDAVDIDHPVIVTPGNPGELGDIPVIDNPDNPHDGNAGAAAGRDVLRVDEPGLSEGMDVTASGYMMIEALDGVASIVIGGIEVFGGAGLTGATVPTDEGYLEVTGFDPATGRLDYTYHLTESTQEHTGEGKDSIAHDFIVTVTDTDGSVGTGVVSVVITDDVPTLNVTDGIDTVVSGATSDTVEGQIKFDFGADDGDGKTFTITAANGESKSYPLTGESVTVAGQYGTLTVNADGSYSYKANPDTQGTDSFTFTITDADGDSQSQSIDVTVTPAQGPTITDGITVDEKGLDDASDDSETSMWEAPAGYTVIGIVAQGSLGTATVTDDGKLEYTLNDAIKHEGTGTDTKTGADTVKVTVQDADGNTFEVDVTVNVIDDVPTLSVPDGPITGGAALGTEGDALLTHTGDLAVDFGADDGTGTEVRFEVGGENGMPESIQVILDGADTTSEVTLSVGADGALKGTLADGEELFSVTLTESSDGDYGYTMSQNHLFQMADGEGKPTGEGLELKFTTQDADGDTASASVTVPLTVEHVDTNAEGSVISNADDAITVSGGGDTAASIVAGDTGGAEGSESTPTNICFVLDISTSMNEKVTAGSNETRLQVAKDSITSFIEEHIIQKLQSGEGLEDINLSLVQFGSGATLKLDVTIADNGNTLMVGDTPYTDVNDFHNAIHAVIDGITAPQNSATNYQYGFQEAAKWFESHAEEGDRNITYFLSDGAPTVCDDPITGAPAWTDKTGDGTQVNDVRQAATAYDKLLDSVGGGMEVHAIGFEGMGHEEMKTLAMFDNTSGGIPGTETVNANGMLYWGSVPGRYDNAIMGTDDVMAQRVNAADMDKSQTYFLFTGDPHQDPTQSGLPFVEVKWIDKEDIPQEWIDKWGDKFVSGWYSVNVEVQGDRGEAPTNYDLGLYTGRIYEIVPSEDAALGSATIINSGSSLSDAFNSAYRPAQLANTGADAITADDAVNSALIYGDVMNTDMLLGELADKLGDKAPGLQPGSGNAVFAWLENPANAEALKGSAFEGWNHESTVKYIAEHGKELGYETRIDPKSSTFYLVDEEGNVLTLDGKPAEGVKLDDLTGREGGNDVITGSDGDDTIYGQEGNDSIHAGAGDDTIYGGTGDDVIYGEAGNDTIYGGAGDDTIDGGAGDDYISGGVGKDTIFAGDGNDIIVYDSEDVTISGGQGIDILVSNDALSMSDVEADSRIEGIEAVITGAGADNLKPADLAGLGIRIDGDTLTIDTTRWTQENSVWKQNDGGLSLELGSMWGAGQDANGNMSYTLTASGSAVMAFAAAHIPDIPVTVEDAASGQEASLVSSLIMPNVDSGTDAASGHPADAQQGDSLLGLDSAGMFGDDAADWPLFPADDAWETDSFLYGSIDGTQGDADMFKTYVDGLNTTDGMTIPAADNGMETSDFPLLGDGSEPNVGLGSADGSDADSPYTADSLTSENVMLFGAEGDDNLFFGGEEYNDVFAGSSDEILVYDANDYLIDGGSGIDFMVGGEDTPSLDDLLNHTAKIDGQPIVNDVDVLITGKDALSLTNIEQLTKDYGITLGMNEHGQETLTLDTSMWAANENGTFDYTGQEDLTLQTNLAPVESSTDADAQVQIFILSNSNG